MDHKKLRIRNSTAEFLIFTSQTGDNSIEVRYQNETIWLSQKMMAMLFDCSADNISLHLKNIFKEGELVEKAVTEEFSATAGDGKNYKTKHHDAGTVTQEIAKTFALSEFEKYRIVQDALYESDFDKTLIKQQSLPPAEDDLDETIKQWKKEK